MNCTQLEPHLPDLLGGELSPELGLACAAHLADCGTCRARVEALQDVQALLRDAATGAERLPLRAIGGMSRSARPAPTSIARPMFAVLRYAAVIVLAFLAGFATRAPGKPVTPAGSSAVAPAAGPGELASNPRLQREYREIASAHPEATSFGRTLLLLARR